VPIADNTGIARSMIAADHDRQLAGLRARHAAGDRSIDQMAAKCCHLLRQPLRDRGHTGTHFDHDGAGFHAGKHVVVAAGQHVLHNHAGRQHGDDDIRTGGELLQRIRRSAAMLLHKVVGNLAPRVIDQHSKPGPHETGRHRPAHVANADEADSRFTCGRFTCGRFTCGHHRLP
jgi:hypothetical protein